MKLPACRRRKISGFSLIELIVVIAIISLLGTLMAPGLQNAMNRARSMKCGNNLRQIGLAVLQSVQDHDNAYPVIETDPSNPVYTPEDNAQSLPDALAPYGITKDTLKCPTDVITPSSNYFAKKGFSYMWNPVADDEPATTIKFYGRRGTFVVNPARLRICTDFTTIHFNRWNTLYADGHVAMKLK